MVVGSVFLGVLVGGIAFLAAVLSGFPFWVGLLTYGLLGAAITLAVAALRPDTDSDSGSEGAPSDAEVDAVSTASVAPLPFVLSDPALLAGRSMRVLAVDDDPLVLDLIPRIAAQVGSAQITTAASGAQALDMIKTAETPFDCLLLDIDMPGMDGIELCAKIRATPGYESVAIVMLTAMSELSYLQRAFRAGATDYTTKPFDIIEFGERLLSAQAWTSVRRPGGDLASREGGSAVRLTASKLLPGMVKAPLLLDVQAFQTYLARMPASALPGAFVMAVALDRLAMTTNDLPSVRHLSQLVRVAGAIDEVFGNEDYVMVYDDQGRFILASSAARMPSALQIEAAIQSRLDDLALAADRARTKISVGSAVRPGGKNMERAKIALNAAVHLAEDRASRKAAGPRFAAVFKVAQP